jgi:hypothetical protein
MIKIIIFWMLSIYILIFTYIRIIYKMPRGRVAGSKVMCVDGKMKVVSSNTPKPTLKPTPKPIKLNDFGGFKSPEKIPKSPKMERTRSVPKNMGGNEQIKSKKKGMIKEKEPTQPQTEKPKYIRPTTKKGRDRHRKIAELWKNTIPELALMVAKKVNVGDWNPTWLHLAKLEDMKKSELILMLVD